MLDPAYLKSRAKLIDMQRAYAVLRRACRKTGGTIYLTAADENRR